MKIVIVEDEKPAADRLGRLLKKHFANTEIYQDIDSVKSAVRWFESNPEPDLIFLDIQLADGLSFDIFDHLSIKTPVIFCTAYDQYAIKAFKLNSIDYLLKPVDPEELEIALNKFEELRRQSGLPTIDFNEIRNLLSGSGSVYKNRFVVKIGDRITAIETKDIAFFYSEHKATYAQLTSGKSYLIDFSLDQLVEVLDPKQYYRLNRKYVASFQSIEDMRSYSNSRLKVKLKNCDDPDILISREKVTDFKNWLNS